MLRLHLLLNRPYYEPGGTVMSTVQVYNDPEASNAAPIRIRELVFLYAGYERTDPNWISNLYKPEVGIEKTEARKGVRTLFKTEGTMLMQNYDLPMAAAHQFTIKFRLPPDLPPTFRGNSIRFNYTVDVKALYEPDQDPTMTSTPPPMYETTATTSLLVWSSPASWTSTTLQRQPQLQQQQQQQSEHHTSRSSHADASHTSSCTPVPEAANTLVPGGAQQQQHRGVEDAQTSAFEAANRLLPGGTQQGGTGCSGLDSLPSPSRAALHIPATSMKLVAGVHHPGHGSPGAGSSPLGSIRERVPDDSDVTVQPLLAVLKGGQSASGRLSSTGSGALLRQNSSSSSGVGGQQWSSGVVSVARTADESDVPCVEYALQQPVQARFREVPVDATLLQGGVAAFGTGAAPLPSTSFTPSTSTNNSLSQAPSASTRTQASQQLPAGAFNPSILPSGRQLSYTASHCNHSSGDDGWSDTDSDEDLDANTQSMPPSSSPNGDSPVQRAKRQSQGQIQHHVGSYAGTNSPPPPAPHPRQFGRLFVLNAGEHPVLKITLQAPLDTPLQPGATFGGLLDLRPAGLRTPSPAHCHHLVVMLETEEVISPKHQPHKTSSGAAGGAIRKLHCEHQEVTTDLHLAHFVFSIPSSATPSFKTPMVGLRWMLRFELTVGKPLDAPGAHQQQLQHLTWALPLIVQAPG